MALIGMNVTDGSAEVPSPTDRIPFIAGITEKFGRDNFGNVFLEHLTASCEAAAGKNERVAS